MSGAAILALPARDIAHEINEAYAAANGLALEATEHAVRCGELLIEAKKQVGHGRWYSWLNKNCPSISERTAQAWMRVARKWPKWLEENPQRGADLPLREVLKLLAGPRQAHNSGDFEWNSPLSITDRSHTVFGGRIELDPASTSAANKAVRAERFYSIEDDALQQEWRGSVYMNPPFATAIVSRFCAKPAGP